VSPAVGRTRTRAVLGLVASLAVLVPLALVWMSSLVPDSYSVMGMGVAEFGGGPIDPAHAAHDAHGWDGPPSGPDDVSVAELTGPAGDLADVMVELVARAGPVALADGTVVDGYTLNGSSPGPAIRARQGELVEVRLVNESVPDGVTLHWHGVHVPNAEDGVAGVTQDAVPPGGDHVYRFVAEDAGSYWYHSHQVSHAQVRGGLYGTLVVDPPGGTDVDHDVTAAVHTYGTAITVNGHPGNDYYAAAAGDTVRVRVVNTDNTVRRIWVADIPFRVVAVDGRDVNQPTDVGDHAVDLAAGGRVDLEFTVPSGGSPVQVELSGAALLIGPERAADGGDTEPGTTAAPTATVDLLHYGTPTALPFDPGAADRVFDYRIGRRPGFLDGRPGMFWTVNGRMYPDVPMYVVTEGDVVRMSIANTRADDHPMHLHGHHAVVLARNGVAATGSSWWTDSLQVGQGDTYEIAFLADNPGIWMDHCHDLPHAADGLVAHLAYAGVHTPFRVGGELANQPE
jgi:FtsP/CotA-like multicopper oxidase with cupredoxin domain